MNQTSYTVLASIFFLFLLFSAPLSGQDTFSIIAVDPETGEVGSAGASCVANAQAFGGVILLNDLIPGKGGINAQAYICIGPHINLVNGMARMELGLSPEQIIDWLIDNDACSSPSFSPFDPEYRQYGIVDLDNDGNPRSAAFTGSKADDYKGHITGPNYSIQGNILLGPEILDSMESRFLNTSGPLAVKLMAALQGANVPGADSRCLDDGTSSTSAFLRVAQPDDPAGQFDLEINVAGAPVGVEPIDSLQFLFDAWADTALVSSAGEVQQPVFAKIYPNPAQDQFTLEWLEEGYAGLKATMYDLKGGVVHQQPVHYGVNYFRLEGNLQNQLVILQVKNGEGETVFAEKILLEDGGR